MENEINGLKKLSKEWLLTTLIAIIPILATAFYVAYEFGFSIYFNFPYQLITANPVSIIIFSFATLFIVFVGIGLGKYFSDRIDHFVTSAEKKLKISAKKFYLIFFFLYTFFASFYLIAIGEYFVIFLMIISLIAAPFIFKYAQDIRNKKIDYKIGSLLIQTVIILLVFFGILLGFGYSSASRNKKYYKLPNNSNLAIVRIYGDNLIIKELIKGTATSTVEFSEQTIIQKIDSGITLSNEEIGLLKPKRH